MYGAATHTQPFCVCRVDHPLDRWKTGVPTDKRSTPPPCPPPTGGGGYGWGHLHRSLPSAGPLERLWGPSSKRRNGEPEIVWQNRTRRFAVSPVLRFALTAVPLPTGLDNGGALKNGSNIAFPLTP